MNIRNFMGEDKVHANKFHNFMVYEVIKHILFTKEFDSKISYLIDNAHLTKENNPFFTKVKETTPISLESALKIAMNWGDITKQFKFTVLISLGELADKISQINFPPAYVIRALQTGLTIISDDLNTIFSEREGNTSKDPDGVNDSWWEKIILRPLLAVTKNKKLPSKITGSPKIQKLLQEMNKLAQHPLGFAVQLYVVEVISLDIILALLPLFARVEVDGQKIFKSSEIISWMMAHIQGESVPQQRVTHEDNRILNIVSTVENQQELYRLAQDYVRSWGEALTEFEALFDGEPIGYYNDKHINVGVVPI